MSYFLQKIKVNKITLSSAAILLGALRARIEFAPITHLSKMQKRKWLILKTYPLTLKIPSLRGESLAGGGGTNTVMFRLSNIGDSLAWGGGGVAEGRGGGGGCWWGCKYHSVPDI